MIRLFLIDDHPIVREGLATVLRDEMDFEVTGAAGTALDAVHRAERLQPDVILLDLELPDMDGVALLPHLLRAVPRAQVLIFTAYSTDERVFGALRAGARGYLLKGAPAEEIARAIRSVHQGNSYLEPAVAARLVNHVHAPPRPVLTPREREVLSLIAAGHPNKQIARTLGITERTVKFHVASILEKLEADSRAQAVSIALQQNLL